MFLSDRFKQCRKESGLSLERLALEIFKKTDHRVSRQTLENWEKGRNQPELSGIIALSCFFERPLEYFFDQNINLTGERNRKRKRS